MIAVAGILMLAIGAALAVTWLEIADALPQFDLELSVYAIGAVFILIGVVVIISGYGAVKGERWILALIGAVISMIFGGLMMILGILGLVFITVTRNEFRS